MPQRSANPMSRMGVSAALAAFVFGAPLSLRSQDSAPPAAAQEQTPQTQPPPPMKASVKSKGRQPYSSSTELIELPATPVLDSEGKQRLDPDGKPMFNPPLKQQRDKFGHPLFDAKGQPVFQTADELGYDEHHKKLHGKTEKAPKTIAVSIAQGTLTVDGMIGKAALNYDISDLRYIYFYAPWIGTVVVSNTTFPGAKEQAGGFNQNTLTVKVEDHTFQLYSEKTMLGGKPAPVFVLVDRNFKLPSQRPEMGFGATLNPPYTWPGAKQNPESKAFLKPPPVPVSLRPTQLMPPCPTGQMRASHVALPGQDAPLEPCLPIVSGRAAVLSQPETPAVAPSAPFPVIEPATNGNPAALPAVTEPPEKTPARPPASATPPR